MKYFFLNIDYRDLLSDLGKKWIEVEIDHRVSKEASNAFWCLANAMFHPMYLAKGNGGRKIPQFPQIRDSLYNDKTPRVKMEIYYKSKENGDISTVKDVSSTPVSKFPPSEYTKLYEIASVDVRYFFKYVENNYSSILE